MSNRTTSKGLLSATFSRALRAGPSLFDSLDGPTTDPSGLDRVHVSRSPVPENAKDKPTPGICGPTSSGLSASAALTQSLGNRLKGRLALAGSMEYRQTWREKVTPSGLRYWAHIASAHRTNDNGFTGWPTATVNDSTGSKYQYSRGDHSKITLKLAGVADVAGWPTPGTCNGGKESKESKESKERRGSGGVNLQEVACIAGWATPTTRDWKDGDCTNADVPVNALLGRQVTGTMQSRSPAATEKRGVLNPDLPRWLMGFPPEWCVCAVTAMQSSPRSRKNLSKRISKSKEIPND